MDSRINYKTNEMDNNTPKSKVKRSSIMTILFSSMQNKSVKGKKSSSPHFEIKTKTINDCAKLIVSKQFAYEQSSKNKTHY